MHQLGHLLEHRPPDLGRQAQRRGKLRNAELLDQRTPRPTQPHRRTHPAQQPSLRGRLDRIDLVQHRPARGQPQLRRGRRPLRQPSTPQRREQRRRLVRRGRVLHRGRRDHRRISQLHESNVSSTTDTLVRPAPPRASHPTDGNTLVIPVGQCCLVPPQAGRLPRPGSPSRGHRWAGRALTAYDARSPAAIPPRGRASPTPVRTPRKASRLSPPRRCPRSTAWGSRR